MHVYEVTPGIYKIFLKIASLKTYSTGYFSKQQKETGYFCGMTLQVKLKLFLDFYHFDHHWEVVSDCPRLYNCYLTNKAKNIGWYLNLFLDRLIITSCDQ